MIKRTKNLGLLFVIFMYLSSCTSSIDNQYKSFQLKDSWRIQNSEYVTAKGAEISNSGFDVSGWYKAEVPQTIFAVLIQNSL